MSGVDDLLRSAADLKAKIVAQVAADSGDVYGRAVFLLDDVIGLLESVEDSAEQAVPASDVTLASPPCYAGDETIAGSYIFGLSLAMPAKTVGGSYTFGLSLSQQQAKAEDAVDAPVAAAVTEAAVVAAVEEEVDLPDKLTRIKGISPDIASALNAKHVTRFRQIANWSGADVASLSTALGLGRQIQGENWIEQAAILAKGERTVFDMGDAPFAIDYGSSSPVVSAPVANVVEPDAVPKVKAFIDVGAVSQSSTDTGAIEPDYSFLRAVFIQEFRGWEWSPPSAVQISKETPAAPDQPAQEPDVKSSGVTQESAVAEADVTDAVVEASAAMTTFPPFANFKNEDPVVVASAAPQEIEPVQSAPPEPVKETPVASSEEQEEARDGRARRFFQMMTRDGRKG